MDSSFSVKHEHQTKKHLGLYSSEFPALHLPTMEALWLRAPELNSGSRLPISEMEATHDLKISMVVLSHPSSALSFQWCRGLRSCFPSNDPTITVATDHLIPIDSYYNKLLHGSQLTATGIGVGQTQRVTEMHPPVKNKIAIKINCDELQKTERLFKQETSNKQKTVEERKEKKKKDLLKRYLTSWEKAS